MGRPRAGGAKTKGGGSATQPKGYITKLPLHLLPDWYSQVPKYVNELDSWEIILYQEDRKSSHAFSLLKPEFQMKPHVCSWKWYECRVGWSTCWEKNNLVTFHVVLNWFRTPIPKFHLELFPFGLGTGPLKVWTVTLKWAQKFFSSSHF